MIRLTSGELDRLLVHPMYRRSLRGILIFVALLVVVAAVAAALPALPGLRGIANYLPLHMLFETFAIIVAMLVFAVGWHAHSRDLPGNIVLLGCAFFGVGLLDFAHMLSYAGMPDFVTPSNPEKGIDFWLAARSLAALSLLAAALMPWRPFASAATRYTLLAGVIAATALAYWLFLYHQEAMPRTFISGEGLTPFKIASEYIIILLHLGTALVLWLRMRQPLSFNVTALFGAVCVMALSEFFFTLYSSVTDLYNLLGHLYKAIAYLLLYRVFFVEIIETPYRELELSKSKLRGTLDAIPDLVWLKDPRGVYLDCNATFERFLGETRERIAGRTDYDFVSEELAGSFREHDRKAVVANKPVVSEEWLAYAVDGDHGLFEIVKTPLYDDSGNLIGVLGVARDITGRKRGEEALRRSETRFRTLYESTGDAVMLVGEQGFIDCNKATLAMFGCATKEEFCMMHPADISPPNQPGGGDSRVLADQNNTTAMENGRHFFEWVCRRTDTGKEFIVNVLLNRMTLDGNNILQATVRDITARKLAERALQESEEMLRRAQAIAHVGHFKFNPATGVVDGSDELFTIFGLTRERFQFSDFVSSVHPEDRAFDVSTIESAIRDKTGYEIEHRLLLGDGTLKWVKAIGQFVDATPEEPPLLIGTVQDITMHKNNEAKIERLSRTHRLLSRVNEEIVRAGDEAQLFAAICNAAADSGLFRLAWIGVLDEKRIRVIPAASAGVEQGYTSKIDIRLDDERTLTGPIGRAVRNGTFACCQDVENDPGMTPWRDEAIRRGYRAIGAFPVSKSGLLEGSLNVYAVEADFFTEDIIGLMLELAADVTFALDVFAERKRREQAEAEILRLNADLEQRIAERTRELEAANRELEAFSYSVSHDLRAPLRSIDGFSKILLDTYHDRLDAAGQNWLERVRRASQHMGCLIDDLLRLSQVSRGSLKKVPVNLSEMTRNLADGLQHAHPGHQARFILQEKLIVHADHGLMRIVMENLLGNAWKYSGKKPVAEIEFGARDLPSGSGVERAFFVRDNGAGFSMEYAHKLFGPFQRLHGADEFEGIGIGLATVQRIIHRHHGKVWAEAKEGKGATFYFTLPQNDPETGG